MPEIGVASGPIAAAARHARGTCSHALINAIIRDPLRWGFVFCPCEASLESMSTAAELDPIAAHQPDGLSAPRLAAVEPPYSGWASPARCSTSREPRWMSPSAPIFRGVPS